MSTTTMLQLLGSGMIKTAAIFFLTLLFSLPLGLLFSFGRMARNGLIRGITKFYISVMRGTPLMLQMIVVYFAPYYVFGMRIPSGYRFTAVIIAFVLNYAAYFAEIYRSGIESIPRGQYEAAEVLGYSKAQTFVKIILPQVIKRILPPVTNEMITLVKDTSLAFVLTEVEMFTAAKQIAAKETSMLPLMVAGVFYYIFNLVVAAVMEYVEKRLNYYK
ncbi:MAG: amino acid ABC transporter permease [Lachnospiraceae bacterium]|jgi:polar amino acid transport system permease protein|nr:amino acid ABC transporter permease [Lachnospiraceae bacterium]MCI9388437.1 amino acid ABC transporter permease [Lachnospiraceae bacterium]MCI9469636.1 amino acid ABC transporter permease [Lachnospiraceae bacterium]